MTTPLPPEAVARAQDADDGWMFEYGGHKLPADHITALLDAAAPVIEARACAAERERILPAAQAAVDKFEYDMGFTAPELVPMRMSQLRARIADLLGGETP